MNTVHTLREYVDALHEAGILVESTVSDELAAREIHCLTYDTRALSEDALFICKGAHFKEEYLCDALSRSAIALRRREKAQCGRALSSCQRHSLFPRRARSALL